MLKITLLGNTSQEEYAEYDFSGTALELLRKNHDVFYRGNLRCVDEICSSRDYYWYFYINSALGPDPAAYRVKRGEVIEFRFEKWRNDR